MAIKQGKNKGDKKTPEKSVATGFVKLKVTDHKNSNSNGRIPTMLTTRLYKQTEVDLWTDQELVDRDRKIAEKAELFSFLKNSSAFDNSTVRTLFSLCFCLTNENDEDVMNFSKKTSTELDIPLSHYVTRNIPIKEFTKFMFGGHNLYKRSISVIKDIITLSSHAVAWEYEITDADGKTQKRRKIAPFIIYEIDLPDANGRDVNSVLDDIYNHGTMSITIPRLLLHNLEKRFAYIPRTLITEWGKDGTQNEIFPLLLSELLSLLGNYKDAALKIKKKLKAQHKEDNVPEEESGKIIEEKMKEALTCKILFKSIDDNSVYDYATKGRWDRMDEQVRKNMEWFKDKIHLITEYNIIGKGSKKEVVFVFNMEYPKDKELPDEIE